VPELASTAMIRLTEHELDARSSAGLVVCSFSMCTAAQSNVRDGSRTVTRLCETLFHASEALHGTRELRLAKLDGRPWDADLLRGS